MLLSISSYLPNHPQSCAVILLRASWLLALNLEIVDKEHTCVPNTLGLQRLKGRGRDEARFKLPLEGR